MDFYNTSPNTTRLYELLKVPKDASEEDISRAYKKLSLKLHPDKLPLTRNKRDPQRFEKSWSLLCASLSTLSKSDFCRNGSWNEEKLEQELNTLYTDIQRAKSILTDERDRRIYDRQGEKGVEVAKSTDYQFTTSRSMPNMSTNMKRQSSRHRTLGADLERSLEVTLEELYVGVKKSATISRTVLCTSCEGTGSKSGKRRSCDDCDGAGLQACRQCFGDGEIIEDGDECPRCSGSAIIEEKKVFEVVVEQGMMDRDKIYFRNEASQTRKTIRGSVVFILKQLKHPTFTREGMNLRYVKKITLIESLLGFQFSFRGLNDEIYAVCLRYPIHHGTEYKIDDFTNAGMPNRKTPTERGDIIIVFSVELPNISSLSEQDKETLRRILPAPVETEFPTRPTDRIVKVDVENDIEDSDVDEEDMPIPTKKHSKSFSKSNEDTQINECKNQ